MTRRIRTVMGKKNTGPRGENHHFAVLNWKKVAYIHAARMKQVKFRVLAALFKCGISTVENVANGKTWRVPR